MKFNEPRSHSTRRHSYYHSLPRERTPLSVWMAGVFCSLLLGAGVLWLFDAPSSGSTTPQGHEDNLTLTEKSRDENWLHRAASRLGLAGSKDDRGGLETGGILDEDFTWGEAESMRNLADRNLPKYEGGGVYAAPVPQNSPEAGGYVAYTGLAMAGSAVGRERDAKRISRYRLPYQQGEPNWNAIHNELERIIQNCPATVSLVVEDLEGDFYFTHNAREKMASASLVKLPIMAAVFEEVERGNLRLDQTLPLRAERREGGSGVLKRVRAGEEIPLYDVIYLMITASDNTATTMLSDQLGFERINETCRRLGMRETNMSRGIMDMSLRRKGVENWTSAEDMARFYRLLYRKQIASPASSERMMRILLDQRMCDRLPRYLPADVPMAHKTGLIRGVSHDCGILFLGDYPVLVASLVKNFNSYDTAKRFSADVARVLYDGVVTGAAQGGQNTVALEVVSTPLH